MILANNVSQDSPPKTPEANPRSGNRTTATVAKVGYFFIDEFADKDVGETFLAVMPLAKQGTPTTPPRGMPAYLEHLWRLPILNQAQEQHCFRKLNYLKYLQSHSQINALACIACQKMQDDADAIQESIIRMRNFIVESNLRLVVSIAKRYCSPGFESFDELICIGNASLVRAVDLFDFRRGHRFSTYAYQAIERSIIGAFRRDQRYRSRVATNGDDAMESFAGDAGDNVLKKLETGEAIEQVTELIKQLEEREQYIVKARFGINRRGIGVAFHVIAKEIKLSTTRTVQLFNRSIAKMRSVLPKSSHE